MEVIDAVTPDIFSLLLSNITKHNHTENHAAKGYLRRRRKKQQCAFTTPVLSRATCISLFATYTEKRKNNNALKYFQGKAICYLYIFKKNSHSTFFKKNDKYD